MPERNPRGPRPRLINALLRKGHAHTPSRSSERAQARGLIEDEWIEYLAERDERDDGFDRKPDSGLEATREETGRCSITEHLPVSSLIRTGRGAGLRHIKAYGLAYSRSTPA